MGKYYSTKHYGHNIGLSAVFRQPNADHSHCHLLHGYSLAFTFTFGCTELDQKNWAVDFGGLKPLKAWLEDNFDHKTAIDKNDPYLDKFMELQELDLAEIVVMDGVGAEKFAEHAFNFADKYVKKVIIVAIVYVQNVQSMVRIRRSMRAKWLRLIRVSIQKHSGKLSKHLGEKKKKRIEQGKHRAMRLLSKIISKQFPRLRP